MIAETQHVVSRVKDNSGESVHIELCTKPFKMLEIFIPDGGTAFHLNPGAMSVVALNDKINFALVTVSVMYSLILQKVDIVDCFIEHPQSVQNQPESVLLRGQ